MNVSQHRKDIDFLRAIAVLSVVIFHAFPDALPGGFIGVDIFFVISGYLITKKIINANNKNTFSFSEFYQGRAYRLLPMLFVVILFSSIMGLFYSLPDRYNDLIEAGVLSLVYVGNTFFARKGDYFSSDYSQHPLLHLWSLSLEEQFYFIWPLFLILFLTKAKYFLPAVIAAIVGLTWLAEVNNHLNSSYFLLQYRGAELLIGALCSQLPRREIKSSLATPMTLLSLSVMFINFFTLDKESEFPGLNTLPSTISAATFLYFAPSSHPHTRILLHAKHIGIIGLISYSMYLWHWPLLVFGKKSGVLSNTTDFFVYFLLLYIVSYYSWKNIEQKFRYSSIKSISLSSFALKRLLPVTIVYAAALSLLFETGFQKFIWQKSWGENAQAYYQSYNDRQMLVERYCHERPKHTVHKIHSNQCKIGSPEETISMIAIGDSHAEHFARFFNEYALRKNKTAQLITRSACLPLLGTQVTSYENQSLVDDKCMQKNKYWYDSAVTDGVDTVFLAAYWSSYITPDNSDFPSPPAIIQAENRLSAFQNGLINTVQHLMNKGIQKVVLVAQVPEFSYAIEECVFDSIMSFRDESQCVESRARVLAKHKDYLDIFSEVKAIYPSLEILSFTDMFCNKLHCSPFIDGTFVYYNDDHLNYPAGKLLSDKVFELRSPKELADNP